MNERVRPSLEELQAHIAAIEHLDLEHLDLDIVKKTLPALLHHYVHPSPLIQPGERIFRAVVWPARPTLRTHLTYPPSKLVKAQGRANRPGESIFYGSVSGTSAMQELAPPHGTRLAVSMWRVPKPMLTVAVGYSESAFKELGASRWAQIWWRQRKDEPEPLTASTPENELIDRFLAKEFTRRVPRDQEWRYKLSVAITEAYLKALPAVPGTRPDGMLRPGETISGIEVAGLVYPAIAVNAESDNIALKSKYADECLEFVWVHYIEIARPSGAKPDEFNLKGLDYADKISKSGELMWISSFPNTFAPGADLRVGLHNGKLVMLDSLNKVVSEFSGGSTARK